MSRFRQWFRTLAAKPDLVLLGVILFTLGNSVFAISYLNNLEANFSRIYQDDLRGGDALQAAQSTLLLLDAEFKDAMLLTGRTNLQKVRRSIDSRFKAIGASLARASQTLTNRLEKSGLASLKTGIKDYMDKVEGLFNQLEAGEAIADEQVQSLNQAKGSIEQVFQKLNRAKVDDARKTFNDVEFQLHFSMILTLATLFLTIVLRFVKHLKHREKTTGSDLER